MAATTRPYICVYNGVTRMVDAKDPGAVVRHVVGAAVTELRPARGGEVSAWAREKKEIEVAGVAPLVVSGDAFARDPVSGADATVEFTADDMWAWFDDQVPDRTRGAVVGSAFGTAMQALHDAKVAEHMNLMQFDEIRAAFPKFGKALVEAMAEGQPIGFGLDDARGALEQHPLPFASLVELIGEQKRRELYVDDPAGGGDKMVGSTGHIDA